MADSRAYGVTQADRYTFLLLTAARDGSLTDGKTASRMSEIVALANSAFALSDAGGERRTDVLVAVDYAVAAIEKQSDSVVGYVLNKISPENQLLHYSGLAISPTAARRGLATTLVRLAWLHTQLRYIAFSTQSPVIYALMRNVGWFNLYPAESCPTPRRIAILARQIAKRRGFDLDHTRLVVRNRYNRFLYTPIPRCEDNNLDHWFMSSLGAPQRTTRNAMLVIGERLRDEGLEDLSLPRPRQSVFQ